MNTTIKRWAIRSTLLAATAVLNSCTSVQPPPQASLANASTTNQAVIKIDGSSTVFPISETLAGDFQRGQKEIQVQVTFSGTGGGFKKFCAGETDINDASRPILTEEMQACKKAGIRYIELPIAYDALTVVVNPKNDWAKDITVEELKKMWEPAAEGKITSWKQVRDSWPDKPLTLYGAGKESGTFDYFTEAIVGQTKASRNDYTASEDDTDLVQGVSKDPNALGYFGYAYYEAGRNQLKPLPVNNGKGPVIPSAETLKNAQYQPLSRPLFIYVNAEAVKTRPEVQEFVDYYLQNAERWVVATGYVPLPDEGYKVVISRFQQRKEGTVFAGTPQLDLKIEELMQKESKF